MTIVLAPDSFKESLSAKEVAQHMALAIREILPEAQVLQIPISDGGEGLLEALVPPLHGKLHSVTVKDPLLRDIEAQYGILADGTTAVVEMAMASGLEILQKHERNPLLTSTYGTGQLLKAALDKGCTKLIVGLGGSATNDGGMGMVKALGGKFLNQAGEPISDGGGALADLHRIDCRELDPRLANCEIIAACDVANPLTGPEGASFVFGGQKGGSAQDLKQLDANLEHYARQIKTDLGKEVHRVPGTGAAGGMGMGLLSFLDAELRPGIDLIMDTLQLETQIANADLVCTGEGKIDTQTLYGKTVLGVAKLAKKHGVPVIALAGKVEDDMDAIYEQGVTAMFSIVDQPMEVEEAIQKAGILVQKRMRSICRTLKPFLKG